MNPADESQLKPCPNHGNVICSCPNITSQFKIEPNVKIDLGYPLWKQLEKAHKKISSLESELAEVKKRNVQLETREAGDLMREAEAMGGERIAYLEKLLNELNDAGVALRKRNTELEVQKLDLIIAARAVDLYFAALAAQWGKNEGRVVSESGMVLVGSSEIETMCNIAANRIKQVLSIHEKGG